MIPWDFEDGLCFKISKSVFHSENYVFIISVYIKSQNSTRYTTETGIDELSNKISQLKRKGAIVVTYDLNTRSREIEECMIVDDSVDDKEYTACMQHSLI